MPITMLDLIEFNAVAIACGSWIVCFAGVWTNTDLSAPSPEPGHQSPPGSKRKPSA